MMSIFYKYEKAWPKPAALAMHISPTSNILLQNHVGLVALLATGAIFFSQYLQSARCVRDR